jgi:hypothetical protein
MSGPTHRFDPRDLAGADGPLDLDDAELTAIARELESVAAMEATPRPADFEDRVMAALADEPPPRPVARGWSLVAIAATMRDAWRLATTGPRPAAIRAQALAIVLLVAVAGLSVGSVAVVGAIRLLSSDPALIPLVTPSPSPSLVAPSASPAPSPTLTPGPSAPPSPSPTPAATDTPDPTGTTGTTEPTETETAEPTETDDPDDTPRPTDTPDPDDTPEPDETPEPSETDDSSGSGGGGDDGGGNSGPGGG